MVNLQLTNKEWYFLNVQIKNIIKECPDNYIAKYLLDKLDENCPNINDIKFQFKTEYESRWVEK